MINLKILDIPRSRLLGMEDVNSIGLLQLAQTLGGVFKSTSVFSTGPDEPAIIASSVDMGDVRAVWPKAAGRGITAATPGGAGLTHRDALIRALAEGLERYSIGFFRDEQFTWATADELGTDALDLDLLPRCSPAELSHPKCPLILPDKTKKIRWVRGISLLNGHVTQIPAVLAYSHAGYAVPGERFWFPISTGCAAHVSYEQAVLTGIYEVAERDALSITWLQQLPLSRIEVDTLPTPLAEYWERYMGASSELMYAFFDATTDLGIPTVYGTQISRHDSRVNTLVSCATGGTPLEAICKVISDLAALRLAFKREYRIPHSWDDFSDVLHGATFMARRDTAAAFDFLHSTPKTVLLSDMQIGCPRPSTLLKIVSHLKTKGLETFVVDLSSDESLRSGMYVVRVIIPGLQPLSFRYRARFLGHERLYKAPAAMGYETRGEQDLNPWPQPFA